MCHIESDLSISETNPNAFRYGTETVRDCLRQRDISVASLAVYGTRENRSNYRSIRDRNIGGLGAFRQLRCQQQIPIDQDQKPRFAASFKSFLKRLDATILSIGKNLVFELPERTVALVGFRAVLHIRIFV